MSILETLASRAFPEGNLQNIKANAPNQMSYNIDATRDLVQNQPFNPLAPGLAFGLSLPYDTLQGIGRAFQDVKSEPGILDYDNIPNDITFADIGKSIAAENPIDSLIGRTYGATLGLGDKLTGYGKSLASLFDSSAMASEPMVNVDNVKSAINAARNREELNRIGSLALDDAGLTMSPYKEFAQVAKPKFNFNRAGNFLTDLKDKGIEMFGSGKNLALRGIGSIIGGPVGGFIGGALGNLKESPTDKFNLEIGKAFGDEYGYKNQLTSGTLGSRQDPFGRNLVSAAGNYEKNRLKEVARLSALQNLNQFQKDKLDFGKKYLEQLETKRQAKIQEMQDRNRATKTGGYQYGTQGGGGGAGSDFMGGSGTAKDMGSF